LTIEFIQALFKFKFYGSFQQTLKITNFPSPYEKLGVAQIQEPCINFYIDQQQEIGDLIKQIVFDWQSRQVVLRDQFFNF